ncbi:RsmB/NOP family class I SAM-dependent RNA methyltransferase [Sphingorhabdus sp. Alg239-R122]|uniref:RsmB/NOP family class I SAM-dependent RNA methyltransferase n=1 Tax=Sphingorhabdus sp. Alg239-R122 TaxID=2305989 RepID=UPI0013DCAA32|nr:RsmB/NOP family class I SAM-dependent RNA methyltransferase [Sphingorhabdus sp. Alg239-R122]
MTPPARVQAAIDLLDEIIVAARDNGPSADKIAANYFKTRRYMGSKDRRAVRDLTYDAIRRFGEMPTSGRAAMLGLAEQDPQLALLFDGSNYGPAAIDAKEVAAKGEAIPDWIKLHLSPLIGEDEHPVLLDRAPLDIRFDPRKTSRAELSDTWPETSYSDEWPHAARLPAGTQIQQDPLWSRGAIDIQDWGSQAIVAACKASGAALVVDLCAGAGGKTLALASDMQNDGRIIASDTNRNRLSRLEPRRQRADAENIETLLLDAGREWEKLEPYAEQADIVLVDAPCSGTGTWRRNPETRWRLTPKRLDSVVAQQSAILDMAAKLVKPGGALVYAVCSLVQAEGAGQIAAFLSGHKGWRIDAIDMQIGRTIEADGAPVGRLLSPNHDGTDGFFMTRLVKS